MNKSLNLLLLAFMSISLFNCSGDDTSDEPAGSGLILSDISVSANVSSITFMDQADLDQQVNSAFVFSNANSQENELVKDISINSDNSIATATIAFLPSFAGEYVDPNQTNNSVTITLQVFDDGILEGIGPTVLVADGPGDTYEAITAAFAPGSNPIEVPDCGHEDFGRHIDEIFDDEVNTNVFRFVLHTDIDNDRCLPQFDDRQRNEIKTFGNSPDHLLAVEGETVEYKWTFKIDEGFQGSPNFTHLHQLKSVGDVNSSTPTITLTARGSSNRMELRFASADDQDTEATASLDEFRGEWVEVYERVSYGLPGTYELEITRLSDNSIIMSHTDNNIDIWRAGADFIRPKWGIYRSLVNAQDLRDEFVLYRDFSIEEFR